MSDEDSDNEKPEGFDISKLGVAMNDEEHKAADRRLPRQLKDLSFGLGIGAAQKAALGLGAPGVFADLARQAEQLRRITDPFGLRGLSTGIDLATLGVSPSILDRLKTDSPFARLASDMERQSRILGGLSLDIDRQFRLMPGILREFESRVRTH